MTIRHDDVAGWSESDGTPRWRSTRAAFDRLAGADVRWRTGAHGVRVVVLDNGTPVMVVRPYPAHKRWSVKIEGFEFWQFVRLLDRETWAAPIGFDTIAEARAFGNAVLSQAGATVRPSSRIASNKVWDQPK